MRNSALLVGLLLVSGCSYLGLGGETKVAEKKAPEKVVDASVETEPEVEKKPDKISKCMKSKTKAKAYNRKKLAKLTTQVFTSKKYDQAESCLEFFIETYPKDSRIATFLFRLGVVRIKLSQFEKAIETLKEMLTLEPLHNRAPDARLELATALVELERNAEANEQIQAVINSTNLEPYLGVRALVLLARIQIDKEQYHIAEDSLWRAYHKYNRSYYHGDYVDAYLMGSIRFYLARIKHAVMREAKVVAPKDTSPEQKEVSFKSLETRTKWLVDTQESYLKVIRGGEPYWAIEAGNQIGVLYEDLFQHLASLPIPRQFTKNEAAAYRGELNARLEVLLKDAILAFKKVCVTADRVRTSNEWVKQSKKSLRRVQRLVESKTKVKAQRKKRASPNG